MASTTSNRSPLLAFRLATVEDADALTRLVNIAFRSEKTGDTWIYDEQDKRVDILPLEVTQHFISGDDTVMLVGHLSPGFASTQGLNDARVATCFLRRPAVTPEQQQKNSHVSPGTAWLGLLAILPSLHGQGLGKDILAEAGRFVKEQWGAERLEFDFVHTRTQLKAWYERQGYQETGKWRDFMYPEGGKEVLRGGLRQIVLGKDLM
ncbi:acyl- N-acyltransferase [Lecanosticta acicola]|uniref:Acyl- N-acyltransferase n=1 Tax=Lecanosticta acicola TaxID=111012 RepID=A0AAI9EAS1_9PEZI|nr:acyl- N-acyltransferase [Lecanosticta acicola]